MLTGDLVRARSYKGKMRPQFLDPGDDSVLEDATWLCALAEDALERRATRGELDETIAGECQIRPDHKQLKGLAKILFDGARFDTTCAVTPRELREKVFRLAAQRGPLAMGPEPFGRPTAADLLTEVASELGLTLEDVWQGLYADRKQEQRLLERKTYTPESLVQRYNVGLVQAILLRATSIGIELDDPSPARVRQLMRYVKFHQLMHRAHRDGDTLHLEIDGPESVLKQSTRYGLKLATFFPALLLNERWRLHADLLWKRKPRTLDIDASAGLVTHYSDRGGYTPQVALHFAARFAEIKTAWKLTPGDTPLDVGGMVVMPDFTLRKGRKRVHLEILGFWRRDYLQRRVAALATYKKRNLLLAVSKRLMADASDLGDFEVIPFAELVSVKKVLEAAERSIALAVRSLRTHV